MPRIRTMGAGLGGSTAKNLNVNGNTGGGNKKQGLATTTNTGVSFASNAIKNKAYGENRDFIFCVNQLGGIGGKSKMFATTADGVKDCVEGPDCPVLEVKEAYMTVFGRHPDASGIKTYCDNFRKKNWTLEMIIIDLINSAEGQAILAALTPNFSNIVINLDTTDTTSLSGSNSPQIFSAASALLEVKNRLALYLSSTSESVNSLTGLTYGQIFTNLGADFHPSNISTAADSDNQFVAGAQGSYVFDGTFSIDLYAFGTISNSFSVTVNLTDNGNPTFATQGQGGGTYEGNAEGGFSNSGFVGFPMAFDNWGTFAAVTATIQNPNYSYGSGLGNAHAFTENDADNQFFYALGSNYIVFLATDASGNTASQTIEVEVVDTIAPTLNVPILSFPLANVANYTLEGNTEGGRNETVTFPGATDVVDANVQVTATIVNTTHDYGSGAGNAHAFTEDDTTDLFFAHGTNTIEFIATDASGNTASHTVEVEVVDTTAPDFSISEEATDENNSVFSISSSTATTLQGNTTGGANGITFTESVPLLAMDIVDGNVSVTATIQNNNHNYGSGAGNAHAFTAAADLTFVYAIGLSTMQFTATDSSNNSTQYSRYINVEDTTSPLLVNIPSSLNQEGNTIGGANAITMTYPTATDDVDANVQVTATIQNNNHNYGSGAGNAHAFTEDDATDLTLVYALGTNEIIFIATDSSNNTASSTRVIEVVDTTNPQLVWSGAQVGGTYEGNEIGGASAITVIFPTASDIVDANVQVTAMIQNDQNHNYGSGAGNAHAFTENDAADLTFVYGVGTSTITFTATDSSNNTDSDTIVVIVEDTTAPVFTAGTTNWTQTTTYNDAAIQAGTALSWVPGGAKGFAFSALPSAIDDVDGAITSLDVSLTNDGVAVTGYTLANAQDTSYVYGVGANVITFTTTDSSGNSSTEVVELIIEDDVAPVFINQWSSLNSQTGTISANVDGGYQALSSNFMEVDSVTVIANDVVDGAVAVIATIYNSQYPTGLPDFEEQDSSGNFYTFPMGVNTITYEATDLSNNTATGNIRQFTVVDDTAPNFYGPGDSDYVIEDTQGGTTQYQLAFLSSGSLPLVTLEGNEIGGRNKLVWMAPDGITGILVVVSNFKNYTYNGVVGGNISTGIICTATIQNPNYDYGSGTNAAHVFTETNAANTAFVYGLGVSTITFTATDQYGNSVNKYIQIEVVDTTAPVITESPTTLNLSSTSNFTWDADFVDPAGFTAVGYKNHNFGAFTASDVVGPVTLSATLTLNGNAVSPFSLADVNNTSYDFPIGTSVLTISATDSSNNTTNNVYNITVVNPGPSLTVPQSLTLVANTSGGGDGLILTFATASSIFSPTVSAMIQNDDHNYGLGLGVAVTFTAANAADPAFVYGLGVNTITFTATENTALHLATDTADTVITVQDYSAPVFTPGTINWAPGTPYNDAAIQAAAPNLAWTNGNVLPAGTPGGAIGFRFTTLPLANDVVDGPITPLDVSLTNDGVEIPGYTLANALSAGQVYRPGTNVITFTATDSSGNTGTEIVNLIIEDDVAPSITTQPVDSYSGNAGAMPGTYSGPQTFSSLVANAAFPALNFVTNYGAQATDNVELDASSPVLSHVSLYETHTYTNNVAALDKLHWIEIDLSSAEQTNFTAGNSLLQVAQTVGQNAHSFQQGDRVRIVHNDGAVADGWYANGDSLSLSHESEIYVINSYSFTPGTGHELEFRTLDGTVITFPVLPNLTTQTNYTFAVVKHVAGTISAGNTFTPTAALVPGIYRSTYRATDTSGNNSYQDVDFQITN